MSGIDSDLIRGHIDTIILKTLFDGDKYGYEILDEVAKKSDGAYELKQPTLYSCLKRLEGQGLISSYWVDSEIGGKRHYYCLTDDGKNTYMENQKNWLRSRQIIDNLIWETPINNDQPAQTEPVKPEESTKIEPDEENKSISDESNLDNIEKTEEAVIDNLNQNESSNLEEKHDMEVQDTTLSIEKNSKESEETTIDSPTLEIINEYTTYEDLEDKNENSVANTIEANQEIQEASTALLLENTDSIDNESENNEENTQTIGTENPEDSEDIMQLLGHFSNNNDPVEDQTKKLEEANEELNQVSENSIKNDFLESFAKHYLNNIENENNEVVSEEKQTEELPEVTDDFNLDIDSVLSGSNSFFESKDSKDKVDFILPNIITDGYNNQNDVSNTTSEDDEIVEFIDNSNLSNFDSNQESNENDITPSYFSFGEDIDRQVQEDVAITSLEDENDFVDISNTDMDSIYISPEEESYNSTEEVYNPPFDYEFNNQIEESNNTIENENIIEDPIIPRNQTTYSNSDMFENITNTNSEIFAPYEAKESISPKYTDEAYKQKLNELTTFAKESEIKYEEPRIVDEEILFDSKSFLEKAKINKNYDNLIKNFENEGLQVRVHTKLVKESRDTKTYVQTNKIRMTRNWISFCFITALLAITYAIMSKDSSQYFNFSYKYFIFGILAAAIIPAISTIIYALNPYKKHVAQFSPSVSLLLSFLIFAQLLTIIYCVNLQLGFFSFTQQYYNHLYWIIPMIISFYPLLNTVVYTTLYNSKNFHA